MSEAPVLYEVGSGGHVATITLNRAENRNSMTPDLLAGFAESVARARADRSLRALIITGRGRSFCAGADFRSRGDDGEDLLPHERSLRTYEPFLSVLDVEVPVIGALNGHAIGGGLGLALVCDIRVANAEARYGANFARLGFHSGMAISYLLPRYVGLPNAIDLLLSGRIISGSEAAALGMFHCAVGADDVAGEALRRAGEIAGCGPRAVRMLKQSIYRSVGWNPRAAAESEAWAQSATIGLEDAREGIRALLEKREPEFTGR